jgi:hypothetical protein
VEEKKSLVHEWRRSGLKQEVYARRHGISARTLRSWGQNFSPPTPNIADVSKAIADARAALERIELALNALEPKPVPVEMPLGIKTTDVHEAAAMSEAKLLPVQRPRFSWDFD